MSLPPTSPKVRISGKQKKLDSHLRMEHMLPPSTVDSATPLQAHLSKSLVKAASIARGVSMVATMLFQNMADGDGPTDMELSYRTAKT